MVNPDDLPVGQASTPIPIDLAMTVALECSGQEGVPEHTAPAAIATG